MRNPFTTHPASVGETYVHHFIFAFKFGAKMAVGGLAAMVHAFFSFLCVTTASRKLDQLNALRPRGTQPAATRGR